MNWLKQFWRDLLHLSKPQFGLKYIVPATALFFTYGTVGHFYLGHISLQNLRKEEGQPIYVSVRFLQGTKASYKYYPLFIRLRNSPTEFRLMDSYRKHFPSIKNELQESELITIYFRTPFQTILGFGKQRDIMQIDKGSKIIFALETVSAHNKKTSIWMGSFAAALWLVYHWFYRRKLMKAKVKTADGSTYS